MGITMPAPEFESEPSQLELPELLPPAPETTGSGPDGARPPAFLIHEAEISAPERSDPGSVERRSTVVNSVYAVFGLIFFFGVGLAGGSAYRFWSNDPGSPQ